MTRRIEADGHSIETALTRALAELAGCDVEKVQVELDAPGLVSGVDTRLTLEIDLDATQPEPAPSDAPATRQAGEVAEVADEEAVASDENEGDDGDEEIDLDAEADAAADFLEGLLDVLELPGDLKIRIAEEHAEIEVVDVGSGALIGRRGQTLESIQELARCSLQREFQRRSHVKIDVEGYRARRLEKLLEKAEEAIEDVLASGEAERLEPMDVFERKAIHRLVAQYDGIASRSQGREPARRIIIEPT